MAHHVQNRRADTQFAYSSTTPGTVTPFRARDTECPILQERLHIDELRACIAVPSHHARTNRAREAWLPRANIAKKTTRNNSPAFQQSYGCKTPTSLTWIARRNRFTTRHRQNELFQVSPASTSPQLRAMKHCCAQLSSSDNVPCASATRLL